jgi:hypothetical protein
MLGEGTVKIVSGESDDEFVTPAVAPPVLE